MKQARRSLFAVALLFLLFLMQQFGLIDPVLSRMGSIPWWIYLVVAGILFSGYQAFSLSRQDKEIDDEWNEEQGNIFIRRMNAEKKKRRNGKNPKAMQ
ncbi:signal peptidase [Sporolactobacillus shoreae]|uniref:Signal peptidase n=1 Tax=Sporolactobacillus shoreae TaxID=1465501 RepID=A0A4Z0GPM8_9BACL|nr:sporulation YhaL family protein [Sporolactobacillus shoreae]TGA99174.1 signal peptidase [Sporolactobacillus shoreae]